MARFKRLQVLNTIQETGLVPLYYNKDVEICKNVLRACYNGGARVFEFTNRGDFAHEVFAELNKFAEKELPELILGVGSIVDAGTCSLYIQLGANFIVSPLLNKEMALVCNRRKIAWMPGCGSLSEISYAEELGAEVAKIFPGSEVGGPSFVKNIKAPMPWTNVMPSGGVSEANIKEWFDAGVFCVGMGSKLITKDAIQSGNWDELTNKVKLTLDTIKKLRN